MPASHINLLQCLGVHRSFLDFAVFSRLLKQAKVICFILLSSGIRILCPSRSILRFSIFLLIDFTRSSFLLFHLFLYFRSISLWSLILGTPHISIAFVHFSMYLVISDTVHVRTWQLNMVLSTTAPSLVLASFSLILCVGCVLCYIRIHLATRQIIWSLPHFFRRVLCFPPSISLSSLRRGPLLFWSCFSRRPSSPCVSLQFCCRCKFSAYWTFSLCCDLFRGDCCTRAFFPWFLWFDFRANFAGHILPVFTLLFSVHSHCM